MQSDLLSVDGLCARNSEAPRKQSSLARLDTATAVRGDDTGQDKTDDYFVAEDEDFLDALSAALNRLTADCTTALRWSRDDAEIDVAIQAAEQRFCTIASICKEAGITVADDVLGDKNDFKGSYGREHNWSNAVASSGSSIKVSRECTALRTNDELVGTASGRGSCSNTSSHPPPAPFQRNLPAELQHGDASLSPTEEIVEVELTDLLTQSHEEMLGLQRVFEDRMNNAERTREEYELKHAKEMRSLQEEMASSRFTMDRIKEEILDSTTRKLEDMHSAITGSQRAIEAGMKDQARYWKAICQELVEEKRNMAQKVAEERGKYTALKAHLASHDETSTGPAPSTCSRVRIRSVRDNDSVDNIRLCGLSPVPSLRRDLASENQGSNEESTGCTSSSSTPTGSSSRLILVPSVSSEPSSAEVSPTHSNSSSTTGSKIGKPTFRRYYLAQKRENRVVLH